MRPPSSRVWAPATKNRRILGPKRAGNCYRFLNCHTAQTIPGARVMEESFPCPPRYGGAWHSYLAWVLREGPFTSCG